MLGNNGEYKEYIYMQDNAPIHTSYKTRVWLNAYDIKTLPWPPYSLDCNPIKHL
ncbi:hypothetical protein K458DRAFT_316871 [Lentithecium fluviatile CBS 122367]|uniref:Tc1-like transposase DDE domain-containing protein n=1 Tax=Lentithecium fluviatile CBS 122367 TaxID=1168545 RepID=A0A6G1IJZ4_9PLEO|nr:hypothetical protein K458DRAFT_316871 [Lentithecium fluviatile CBS 122367]